MENINIFGIIAVIVSVSSFFVAFSQMRIASAKTKLDLYNKRFSIYMAAFEYYQATYYVSHEVIKEKSIVFTKAFRESQFLFDKKSQIFETLGKIQQNGSAILSYEKAKYESDNDLTGNRNELSNLHEHSVKARNEFRENLLLLENQVEKYLKFTNIDGWYFYRK